MAKELYKFRCTIRYNKEIKTGWLFNQLFGNDFEFTETDSFITEFENRVFVPDAMVRQKAIDAGYPEKGLKVLTTERLPFKGKVIDEQKQENS